MNKPWTARGAIHALVERAVMYVGLEVEVGEITNRNGIPVQKEVISMHLSKCRKSYPDYFIYFRTDKPTGKMFIGAQAIGNKTPSAQDILGQMDRDKPVTQTATGRSVETIIPDAGLQYAEALGAPKESFVADFDEYEKGRASHE